MNNTGLQRAINVLGGVTPLANALGVSVQVVSNWRTRGIPAEHCPDIEKATAGAVRCEELRPDVAWEVLRRVCEPAAE